LPHIRQIHKFVEEEQSAHVEREEVAAFENGIGREREVDDVGCEERRVCEYRQTGHLMINVSC
jgi:hypothetical protein